LTLLFAAAALASGLLAGIAIRAPCATAVRLAAVGLLGLLVALGYTAFLELLARPKPIGLEWTLRHVTEATVLGASFDEGEAIYLWLGVDSLPEPRYYVLPWHARLATALQEKTQQALARDARVRIDRPFNRAGRLDTRLLDIRLVPPRVLPGKHPPGRARLFAPDASRY